MKSRIFVFFVLQCMFFSLAFSQDADQIDNNTRAGLILDIAKYVEYDENFEQLKEFSITVLDTGDDFYWDLDAIAGERHFVQGKPIRIYLAPRLSMVKETQIIYLHKKNGFNIKDVLKSIEGKNTLLVTEGYEFKQSMINFLVVDGRPRFEANEELMNEHDLHVDQLFLAQAVKTREDWENLYEVTDEELQEEKIITARQSVQIAKQDSLIKVQLAKLKSLGEDILKKERELAEKIQMLVIKEDELSKKNSEIVQKEKEIGKQKEVIVIQQKEVEEQKAVLNEQKGEIDKQVDRLKKQDQEIKDKEDRIAIQVEALQKQKIVIIAAIIALVLLLGLAYFIYVNYRNKKKANKLLEEKNVKITRQKEEIEKQKEVAEMQRDQIAYQKKHITDSIEYAQKIQRAILPSLQLFSDEIEHFVLYKPRDIVSGDFYWVDKVDNKLIIIAADCTGHGVPGAFMSMLGVSLLNEIILNRNIHNPDEILGQLRKMVIDSLNQMEEETEIKDGMDMTVLLVDFNTDKLHYSGANNPLYHFRKGELTAYKADKMPVAIHDRMDDFSLVTIDLEKGDTFYTFSDGFVDQFGGEKQKKFLSKNFKRVLSEMQDLDMLDQGEKLNQIFEEYRGDVEQVDDVVVIGVRY